jgi:hypothetical protein
MMGRGAYARTAQIGRAKVTACTPSVALCDNAEVLVSAIEDVVGEVGALCGFDVWCGAWTFGV